MDLKFANKRVGVNSCSYANNFTSLFSFYLRVLHDLHRAVKGGPQRRKADHDIHLGVLPHGVGHVLIDWQQDFFVAPVELLLVITTRQNRKCYIRLFEANSRFLNDFIC